MMVVFATALGLAIGSFVAAAAQRIATQRSLFERSRCDGCLAMLRAIDLVPIASYVLSRGHCSRCGAAIGIRSTLVEATLGACFALAFASAAPATAALISVSCACIALGGLLTVERKGAVA
jgi:leader peptidase (prepilin peptidase)/N-methyltransferase